MIPEKDSWLDICVLLIFDFKLQIALRREIETSFEEKEEKMEFLQQGPAETTAYMVAGYAIIFGVMFLYLVSLIVRKRNLEQDLEVLQELEENNP